MSSTPLTGRKLEANTQSSSFEKLSNFKNLRDHTKKKEDSSLPNGSTENTDPSKNIP